MADALMTGTGKVFILPLRPISTPAKLIPLPAELTDKQTDKQKTSYPALPFLREHELEADVLKMLSELTEYARNYYRAHPRVPEHFSTIPAIRYVKTVMEGWDLRMSKDFVDKVYENNARQIEAARVKYRKSWRKRR